jgi:hypothetical protein
MSPLNIAVLLLMAAAVILLGLAAFWIPPAPTRPHVGWLGLCCWALAELLMHVGH